MEIALLKRGIFRYPGGKSRVVYKIISRMPNFIREMREPFVGGGSVFFAMPLDAKRWINDIHPGLIAVYKALRDSPEAFIKKCRDILPIQMGELEVSTKKNGKKYNQRLGAKFQELVDNKDTDPALSYFFINRTVWAGRVNYSLPSRLYYSNPTGWNIVKTNALEEAARHIKNTKITCGDFEPLLTEPGEGVVIYCDPPYVVNTDMGKMDQQYEYNFTLEDHLRFVEAVKKCVHKVCISYDDCSEVREWFSGSQFRIYEVQWKYSGSSMEKKKIGRELIIINYEGI